MADAYLSPVLQRYVQTIKHELGKVPHLLFMQSHGGLTRDELRGVNFVVSGPAGGIVGAVKTAEQQGITKLISFDMGGTSTDVAHYDGAYERVLDTEVAGVRITAPMLQIHTVAAGGGSICQYLAEATDGWAGECWSKPGTCLLQAGRTHYDNRLQCTPGETPPRIFSGRLWPCTE